jgi:asparagine synthase (glutamine-hydrolysing)
MAALGHGDPTRHAKNELMCGIAGLHYPAGAPPEAAHHARAMIRSLRHRGPDGFGYFDDAHVSLAHARLSIIDLATGDQPILNEDLSVCVVANGEIFNYIELRRDLEAAGHQFYTRSDTEVIVHLYEEYGERFTEHLNGQFAIALWDQRRRRLVLTRDRTGIRPMFYSHVGGALVFGSEVKAILALPSAPRSLDLRTLGQVFTYWSPLAPRTAFESVSSLPPGCTLIADERGERIERYWDWSFPERVASQALEVDRLAEELRERLIESVRLQLRADVPVGAYLSGGLDSSTIAALIQLYTDAPLRTFSLEFEEAEFDESAYQLEMARHLGAEHTRVKCNKQDIAAVFPRLIEHVETPIVRTAPAPLMLLAEHVRSAGFKVVLTGEGADEVFGGYDLFKEAKIRRFWARFPESKMRPRLLTRLYGYLKHSPVAGGALSRQFFGQGLEQHDDPAFAHLTRWSTTKRLWRFFSDDARAAAEQGDPSAAITAMLPSDFERWVPIGRDQYVEAHTLLAGYLLSSQGDRVAMAHSVEGRFPFLDHHVIEFASRLHPELKIRGLNEKFLLKRAMRGLLPPAVTQRVKQPYRSPDSQSFFSKTGPPEYVSDLLAESSLRSRGYFEPRLVSRLVEKCRAGHALGFADNTALVGILSTMLLDEIFIRGRCAPPDRLDAIEKPAPTRSRGQPRYA